MDRYSERDPLVEHHHSHDMAHNTQEYGKRKEGGGMGVRLLVSAGAVVAVVTVALGIAAGVCAYFLVQALLSPSPLPSVSSAQDGGNTQLYFAVVGDYGRKGQHRQDEVAHQMAQWCSDKTYRYVDGRPVSDTKGRCDLVIGVGDNFYDNGVSSVRDVLFKESFEDVYRLPGLHSTRMYQILGNHDYRKRIDAQIDYTLHGMHDENNPQYNDRWYMPNEYYHEVVNIGSGNSDLDPDLRVLLVFLDTNPMIKKYYIDDVTNKTALRMANVPQQIQWVRDTLDRHPIRKEGDKNHSPLAVDYKIVIGHHPMYSCGYHLNNQEIIDTFEKMFHEQQVTAYIAGHDHNLQYIVKDGEMLHHLVSGAGSSTRPLVEPCGSPMKFGSDESGFMFVRLNKHNMHIDMINYEGKTLATYTIPNVFNRK